MEKKMIKIVRALMLTLAFALFQTNTASAATYTDVYTADAYLSALAIDDRVSWTFDLRDDGFNPLTEEVVSATVTLNLHDDNNISFFNFIVFEFASLYSGDTLIDLWEVDTGTRVIMIESLIQLNDNGLLSMVLEAEWGDFYFDNATLTAETDVSAVPVPAAVWLFASGLIGLVGISRRKV